MEKVAPELLLTLQGQLAQLYDTQLPQDVRDYLVTDRVVRDAMLTSTPTRASEEQLILTESQGGLQVALYLDAAVLKRLAGSDPRQQLSGRNLADFWTVLEGVSHFHYLVWNAAFDKPVTLLELEVQAEVDKYLSTRLLLEQQPRAELGGGLWQRLFTEPVLDPQLNPEEIERYQAASTLAARYCARLEARFPALGDPALRRELCTFYRLSQTAKIARIRGAGFA